jgi:hypothetical protein
MRKLLHRQRGIESPQPPALKIMTEPVYSIPLAQRKSENLHIFFWLGPVHTNPGGRHFSMIPFALGALVLAHHYLVEWFGRGIGRYKGA